MYGVSERFHKAVQTSHQATSWVEILPSGERIDGIVTGSVKLDSTQSIRASIDMTIADPSGYYLDTGSTSDVLGRFGTEVRAWRGVVFDDGIEAVPLGVFRIESNEPTEQASGFELAVTGRDRSSVVNRKTPRPIALVNGTPLNDAIRRLVTAMLPGAVFDLYENQWTTGTMLVEAGGNPWDVAAKLAAASGLVLFVDRLGIFRSMPGLAPDDPVQWLFDEGERCTWTTPPSVGRGTGQPIPNGYIVSGTSTGSTSSGIQAEAWDMDPASPTYRYGPYGENVETVSSDKIRTLAQAQLAADMLLRQALGASLSMTFSSIVHPALDPYDVVWARRSKVGIDRAFYLAAHEIPLSATDPANGTLAKHFNAAEAVIQAQIAGLIGEAGGTV